VWLKFFDLDLVRLLTMPAQARQHDQEGKSAHVHQLERAGQSILQQQARHLWHQRKGQNGESSSEDEAPRTLRASTGNDLSVRLSTSAIRARYCLARASPGGVTSHKRGALACKRMTHLPSPDGKHTDEPALALSYFFFFSFGV
jgi:hypothetical protein